MFEHSRTLWLGGCRERWRMTLNLPVGSCLVGLSTIYHVELDSTVALLFDDTLNYLKRGRWWEQTADSPRSQHCPCQCSA